jgi:hypothetical protein
MAHATSDTSHNIAQAVLGLLRKNVVCHAYQKFFEILRGTLFCQHLLFVLPDCPPERNTLTRNSSWDISRFRFGKTMLSQHTERRVHKCKNETKKTPFLHNIGPIYLWKKGRHVCPIFFSCFDSVQAAKRFQRWFSILQLLFARLRLWSLGRTWRQLLANCTELIWKDPL